MAEKLNPPLLCFGDGEKKKKLGGGRTSVLGVIPYSTRVLGSKGRAVGWGIGPLPYPSLVRLLPIIGRPCPGTSALDTLSARGVCRDLLRLALCGEHRTHF
jgi:hypothetical protein